MNRTAIVLLAATFFPAVSSLAQQAKILPPVGPPPTFYEFKYLDIPTAVSVTQLAAQLFNVDINFNSGVHAAVIRPFPRAVDDWEKKTLDFFKRYDVPPPAEPQVRYVAYLIRASNASKPNSADDHVSPIPKQLDDAIAEMKSSLVYTHYDLLTTVTSVSQGSASASDVLPGSSQSRIYSIEYPNVVVARDRKSLSIRPFQFRLNSIGTISVNGERKDIAPAISSNITIHEGQKLVLGKVRLSDDADIFVVLTAKVE